MDKLTKDIRNFIAEHPNCKFIDIVESGITGPTPCGEIWSALNYLKHPEYLRDKILIEGAHDQETFRLAPGSACYIEAVQDITIQCYQKLYDQAENPDHVQVLSDIRIWAREFEDWWWNLPESKRDELGYWESIDKFCEHILSPGITRDGNLQEFTAICVDKLHYDKGFGYLFNELNMSREDAFAKIREWADEFWSSYREHDFMSDYENGLSYYDLVDKFLEQKFNLHE